MTTFGIYIHTPYCVQKCPYCDFATVATDRVPEAAFISALTTEIRDVWDRLEREELGDASHLRSSAAASVYLGGGTPSLLSVGAIESVLATMDEVVGISKDAEITMEVNPGTHSDERFAGYRAAGVNRLSIGVQSLDDDVLESLGRIHDAQAARDTMKAARTAGFDNVSIDLIFATAGMDLGAWERGLRAGLELEPEHVSAYALTVEAATPLAGWVKSGDVVLPDDDTSAAMYERAGEILEAAGFPRYEISNYAPAARRAFHNSLYWTYHDYLAFGPSAHAFLRAGAGGTRWWNDKNPQRYLDAAGRPALGGSERITGARAMGEMAFLALRTSDGLDRQRFVDTFGQDPEQVFGDALQRYVSLGLLLETEAGYALTDRGFLVAETVFADLL